MRGTHMLTLSKPTTATYGLHSFSYFSSQQWNDLSDVCNVSIRLISFHSFLSYFESVFFLGFRYLNLFLEDISYECSYSKIRVKIKVICMYVCVQSRCTFNKRSLYTVSKDFLVVVQYFRIFPNQEWFETLHN